MGTSKSMYNKNKSDESSADKTLLHAKGLPMTYKSIISSAKSIHIGTSSLILLVEKSPTKLNKYELKIDPDVGQSL